MTMYLHSATRALRPGYRPAQSHRLRTFRRAAGRTIDASGRMYHAFIVYLMRRQMRRALTPLSDRLLADIGITRSGIEAYAAELFPHRDAAKR